MGFLTLVSTSVVIIIDIGTPNKILPKRNEPRRVKGELLKGNKFPRVGLFFVPEPFFWHVNKCQIALGAHEENNANEFLRVAVAAYLDKRGVGDHVGVCEKKLTLDVDNETASSLALLLLFLPRN